MKPNRNGDLVSDNATTAGAREYNRANAVIRTAAFEFLDRDVRVSSLTAFALAFPQRG